MFKRLVILLVLIAVSGSLQAQRFNQKQIVDSPRYHQWEAGLLLQYQRGTSEDFEGGSALDIDDTHGFGFTFGWNWTAKWHLSWRFALTKPDYTATIVPELPTENPATINYRMSKYSNQFNLTYHFFEGPLTPFVMGGVGFTRLDSNVIDRPPATGCWWDPWWGWVCTTTWSTYDTTRFSYNAGLGLRWDINPAFYSRFSYNREWFDGRNGKLAFDQLTLEAGFMW